MLLFLSEIGILRVKLIRLVTFFIDYNNYLDKYNKTYNDTGYWVHYENYIMNMDKMDVHNSRNLSWKMGVNNFTDMSFGEFKQLYLGTRSIPVNTSSSIHHHHHPSNSSNSTCTLLWPPEFPL